MLYHPAKVPSLSSTILLDFLSAHCARFDDNPGIKPILLTGGYCGSDASGNVDKDKVQSFTEYVSSKPGIQGPGMI